MNEQEILNKIKLGVKSPSLNFTDKVMNEVLVVKTEVKYENKWKFKAILLASFLILILSIFVKLPEMEFLEYTIPFSPVAMPIISLILVFIVLHQLQDLKNWINAVKKIKVVQDGA